MRRKRFVLPIAMSALIVLPGDPFVAAAAAQSLSAAARAGSAGLAGAAAGAAVTAPGINAAAPAPLTLSLQTFAAPLAFTAASPSASLTAAPLSAAAAPSAAALMPAPETLPLSAAPEAGPARAEIAPGAPAAAPLAAAAKAQAGERAASSEQAAPEAQASALFDGAKTPEADASVFIVRHGQAPIAAKLSELPSLLKDRPELAAELNAKGGVRLVVGGRAGQDLASSPEFKAKYPSVFGIAEVSPLKQAWSGVIGNPLFKALLFPVQVLRGKASLPSPGAILSLPKKIWSEARFLGRTFADSASRPLPSEIAGGIATKSFPLATSIGVYWATVGLAHPLAMIGLMALSLFQETFHGIFLNTWNNFQDSLSRLRGFAYQMNFNLIYMQGFGALYRALSWSADPHKTIPPWSPFYWKDVLVMSLVGTFFGTLGYNGLNTLYAKGRLKRWQRSGIQQLRDVLFLLAGPFFATGSMHAFWALFVFQQTLDLTIALLAWRAKTRTTLYVVPAGGSTPDDASALTQTLRERGVTAPVSVEKLTAEALK